MTINNSNGSSASGDGQGSSGSRKLTTAAMVVGAILLLGIVLSFSNILGGQKDATPAPSAPAAVTTPAAATTSSSAAPSAAGDASVCGLTAVEMSGSVPTAPNATWSLVGTTAAPAVVGQGPGKIEQSGYRNCYARTPTGALLATANLMAMGSREDLTTQSMKNLAVPGPGRDKALAEPGSPRDPNERVQLAGYRVLRYDGTSADIDLAMRVSSGVLASQVFNLRWSNGDWKFLLADSGQFPVQIVQIPSLTGYIPWSGA